MIMPITVQEQSRHVYLVIINMQINVHFKTDLRQELQFLPNLNEDNCYVIILNDYHTYSIDYFRLYGSSTTTAVF